MKRNNLITRIAAGTAMIVGLSGCETMDARDRTGIIRLGYEAGSTAFGYLWQEHIARESAPQININVGGQAQEQSRGCVIDQAYLCLGNNFFFRRNSNLGATYWGVCNVAKDQNGDDDLGVDEVVGVKKIFGTDEQVTVVFGAEDWQGGQTYVLTDGSGNVIEKRSFRVGTKVWTMAYPPGNLDSGRYSAYGYSGRNNCAGRVDFEVVKR